MSLFTLFGNELSKMYRQRGTYAGYVLMAAFVGLSAWGMRQEQMHDPARSMGDEVAVGGNLLSGPFMAYMLLVEVPMAVPVFIPLLISMIAGGMIAGEAQRGTLRTMLTRPVHRWAVVVAKLAACFVHAATLVLCLACVALLVGGRGDIIVMHRGFTFFAEPEAMRRLTIALGITIATICAVAAVALFCSTVFEHPLTASGVTLGFLIVSGALMVIPYFAFLKPYLMTSHFSASKKVFEKVIDWGAVQTDLAWLGVWAAAAVAGTLAVFCRKNVTC